MGVALATPPVAAPGVLSRVVGASRELGAGLAAEVPSLGAAVRRGLPGAPAPMVDRVFEAPRTLEPARLLDLFAPVVFSAEVVDMAGRLARVATFFSSSAFAGVAREASVVLEAVVAVVAPGRADVRPVPRADMAPDAAVVVAVFEGATPVLAPVA